MKKWMLIKPTEDAPVQVWEYIDNLKEAMKYWYVKDCIEDYGAENVMPIVMNRNGGYHTHKPDRSDVLAIIESPKEPNLSLFQQYPINSKTFRTGWISPDCTTFTCEYMGHIRLAMKLVTELLGMQENVTADDYLLDHGWIKVMNGTYLWEYWKINDKQVDFVKERGFVEF